MRPDFLTFQYTPRAKIPIHHGAQTDRKGRIDKKQAYWWYSIFPWYRHVHDIDTNSYHTIFPMSRHLSVVYISASVTGK